MRIGVVSDTHLSRGGPALPRPLIEGLKDPPVEAILHAGDITHPEVLRALFEIAPVIAVAGNNDPPELVTELGRKRIVTLGGVKIGLIHGDGWRGSAASRALQAFAADPVEVIVFGHSHVPLIERHGDRWLFNPGSPTDKRTQSEYSYGLLEIADGRVTPSLRFYRRG